MTVASYSLPQPKGFWKGKRMIKYDAATATDLNDGNIKVSRKCVITGKLYAVTVEKKGFLLWQSGSLIQTALPSISSEDREFLISGTSPEGWTQMYGEEE
jgi:hypothetical protein